MSKAWGVDGQLLPEMHKWSESGANVVDVTTLPAVLNMRQVQAFLGVSKPKAYEIAHSPGFPLLRFGRIMRVNRDSFLQWLAAQAGERPHNGAQ